MRFAFHYRQPFTKQVALLEAVHAGAKKCGDTVVAHEVFDQVRADVDGLVLYGIGGHSRAIFDAYRAAGKRVVFFDKGYSRGGWLRVAVDDFQPLAYMSRHARPAYRFKALGLNLQPYMTGGDCILLDGASNKYCLWQGMGDWIAWGAAMVQKIRQHTDRPIIYRPRPSHNGGQPVPGAELSMGPLDVDLARAHVVVSYGGNIGFDCLHLGVPHFAIGDSVARALSETDWNKLEERRVPGIIERTQWFWDVAYCQWTTEEIASGKAWDFIRGL